MAVDKQALEQQMRNDPRVLAAVQEKAATSQLPGRTALSATELQSLGYDVPGDFKYYWAAPPPNPGAYGRTIWQNAIGGHLNDEHDAWDTGITTGALGVMTLGAGMALAGGGAAAAGGVGGAGAEGGASTAGLLASSSPYTAALSGAAPSIAGGSAAAGAGAAGGLLASSSPYTAALSGTAPGVTQGAASAAGGASSGGLLSKLGSGFREDPYGSAQKLGGLFSSAASGAADGRRADALAQVQAGRVNQDALALDQRRAALRSLLGGVQDAQVQMPAGSTIPQFNITGGLRPSALSNKDALMAELSKPAPTVDPAKAGAGEKVLGGAGTALSILGALGGIKKMSAGSYF